MADLTVFLDARGDERALRASWHQEQDLVVLSLWRDNVCVGTFRLDADELPAMIDFLKAAHDRSRAARRTSARLA